MLNGKYKQQHQMMLLRKIDKETYIDISDKLWNHVLKKKKKGDLELGILQVLVI